MEEREYNKYRRRLRAFLKKYGNAYPPEVVAFIKSCFKESLENIYDVDIMMQVKQAIGVKYDKPSYSATNDDYDYNTTRTNMQNYIGTRWIFREN